LHHRPREESVGDGPVQTFPRGGDAGDGIEAVQGEELAAALSRPAVGRRRDDHLGGRLGEGAPPPASHRSVRLPPSPSPCRGTSSRPGSASAAGGVQCSILAKSGIEIRR
ncbi:hypothetical protein THAOC_23249, partial [Thalassiosira oceanica]